MSDELIAIPMPHMGVSVVEGTVTVWHKAAGDAVKADEMICEIATDKVDTEVLAPADGVLARLVAAEGETVAVGEPLAEMLVGADAAAAFAQAEGESGRAPAQPSRGPGCDPGRSGHPGRRHHSGRPRAGRDGAAPLRPGRRRGGRRRPHRWTQRRPRQLAGRPADRRAERDRPRVAHRAAACAAASARPTCSPPSPRGRARPPPRRRPPGELPRGYDDVPLRDRHDLAPAAHDRRAHDPLAPDRRPHDDRGRGRHERRRPRAQGAERRRAPQPAPGASRTSH